MNAIVAIHLLLIEYACHIPHTQSNHRNHQDLVTQIRYECPCVLVLLYEWVLSIRFRGQVEYRHEQKHCQQNQNRQKYQIE